MITATQLVAHGIGDYILQSDWMAAKKSRSSAACAAHVLLYVLPFLLLTRSPLSLAVIVVTHFLIDRFRLARYVVWAKNFMAPKWLMEENPVGNRWVRNLPWRDCRDTFGYPPSTPVWMSMWLTIVVDNLMHVIANGAAIHFFG